MRGKFGTQLNLNIYELVVGDVIELNAGDMVPADCIVINSANFRVEETKQTGAEGFVSKDDKYDSFLFAESYVHSGSAKAVVACVGRHSTRGITEEKLDTTEQTPLQGKLFNLSKTFTFIGVISALVILITSFVILTIQMGADEEFGGRVFMKKLMSNFTLTLIIIMVAIPEGLPMTVAVSLAYSVGRLYSKDNILVRDLNSTERMAQITELLTGKTGTLTTEKMTV